MFLLPPHEGKTLEYQLPSPATQIKANMNTVGTTATYCILTSKIKEGML